MIRKDSAIKTFKMQLKNLYKKKTQNNHMWNTFVGIKNYVVAKCLITLKSVLIYF